MEIQMKRQFTILSESWYNDACLKDATFKDEVMFGLYGEDSDKGGTTGEMSIRWYNLGSRYDSKLIPQLAVFDDAWANLATFKDVLDEMAKVNNQNITVRQFIDILVKCGFEDITERVRN